MSKPRLLDLFCGAGGATRGYQIAGFHVTGVDVNPQPHYIGDAFHQADAMTFPLVEGFDAIHASPPCKAHTTLAAIHKRDHPNLLTPIRERLLAETDSSFVIENVPGSPMWNHIQLCGTAFGLMVGDAEMWRHRWFEGHRVSWPMVPPCGHRQRRFQVGVYGHGATPGPTATRRGGWSASARLAGDLLGIDWMNRDELAQAIPPAVHRVDRHSAPRHP